MKKGIYQDEGYKLMAAAFEVHKVQGYGMAEELYQECLEIELELRGISFKPKQALRYFYKGRELQKCYLPDLFVFDCLIVELKSVTALAPEHEAQVLNYMRVSRKPVGYLINFGSKGGLEWKRFILSELILNQDN